MHAQRQPRARSAQPAQQAGLEEVAHTHRALDRIGVALMELVAHRQRRPARAGLCMRHAKPSVTFKHSASHTLHAHFSPYTEQHRVWRACILMMASLSKRNILDTALEQLVACTEL